MAMALSRSRGTFASPRLRWDASRRVSAGLILRLLGAAALLLWPSSLFVSGLFLDEIGRWDWAQHNIGAPTKILHSKKAALTVSEGNVLALVSWTSGKLAWRKVLDGRTILDASLAPDGRAYLVTSEITPASEGILSVLCVEATASGDLVWESRIEGTSESGSVAKLRIVLAKDSKNDDHVLVTYQKTLLGLDPMSGETLWKVKDALKSPLSAGAEILPAGAVVDLSGLYIPEGNANGGTAHAPRIKQMDFKGMDYKHLAVMSTDFVALRQNKSGKVDVYTISAARKLDAASGAIAAKASIASADGGSGACFVSNDATLHSGGKGVAFLPIAKTPKNDAVSSATSEEKITIAESNPGKKGVVSLHTWSPKTLSKLDGKDLVVGTLDSPPTYIKEREGKLMLQSAGHQLQVVERSSGTLVWDREEGLATLVDAKFWNVGVGTVPLVATATSSGTSSADGDAGAAAGIEISDMVQIATSKFEAALDVFENLGKIVVAVFIPQLAKKAEQAARKAPQLKFDPSTKMTTKAIVPSSAETLRSYDANQLIFGLSVKAKKVFAVDAPTGKMVWSKYLGKTSFSSTLASSEGGRLSLISEKVVVELGGSVTMLDPRTGKEEKTVQLAAPPEKYFALDGAILHTTKDVRKAIYTKLADNAPAAPPSGLYGFDCVGNRFSGYSLAEGSLEKLETWNLDFGALGETVLKYQESTLSDKSVVPVHVRGDASVMFRFLDPNMVAVVTERQDDTTAGNSGVTLYLLNGVSGQIIHQNRIADGTGPVQLLAAENWAILHYYNRVKSRYELYVVDLYENREDPGAWKLLFGSDPPPKSSFHLDTPVAIHQTFLFPHRVTALGLTNTAKGITQKAVLFALANSEQVMKLNKDQWLNPRRPLPKLPDGTEDKARTQTLPKNLQTLKDVDVLIPYMPLLVVQPTDVLSYYKPIRVEKFSASVTGLESTSLVFGYGSLDLFFSPVRPSQAYDILGEAFDFFVLYSTFGVIVFGWALTQKLVGTKGLRDRW
eukprot:CAMPEP_0178996626 /NCGR_PEP_ID=MMETSP0795-20121207/8471_1 /TAXON_ID=88552 /ORGANISM="Amoebophrya sp., Strain Ameob2" /LENGTH=1010 /DNA_ID=CAMNT_0020689033 /DNA_START=88 /DNA_END=3117 /DNA_ORIENTATION=+